MLRSGTRKPHLTVSGSIKIATAFGIPIRLHLSFFLLLLLPIPLLVIPSIFGAVLLHELGHSLMARRFGIRVIDITFWPLGGMARMSNLPESPRVEGWVAIAGPAVNFALALLTLMGMALALLVFPGLTVGALLLDSFAGYFLYINVALGTFNLLPAFPMDGGRILRAWLARRRDWITATELAVRIGRYVAIGMVLLPLALSLAVPGLGFNVLILLLIAVYIYFVGAQELMAVRIRHGQSPFGNGKWPRGFRPPTAEPEFTVHRTPEPPPASSRPGEARRPTTWEGSPSSGGFDEERVRELERYQGRLRRYPDDE
jgi:Zn-dependent protease